jgi:superfamily II DNA helicase RecQ
MLQALTELYLRGTDSAIVTLATAAGKTRTCALLPLMLARAVEEGQLQLPDGSVDHLKGTVVVVVPTAALAADARRGMGNVRASVFACTGAEKWTAKAAQMRAGIAALPDVIITTPETANLPVFQDFYNHLIGQNRVAALIVDEAEHVWCDAVFRAAFLKLGTLVYRLKEAHARAPVLLLSATIPWRAAPAMGTEFGLDESSTSVIGLEESDVHDNFYFHTQGFASPIACRRLAKMILRLWSKSSRSVLVYFASRERAEEVFDAILSLLPADARARVALLCGGG